MNFSFTAMSRFRLLGVVLIGAAWSFSSVAYADGNDEKPFLTENDAAMNKMMSDMTVKPSGDVDHDFVAMMVPHHQGAIDMARAELQYGKNEQLRRIARATEKMVENLAVHRRSRAKRPSFSIGQAVDIFRGR